MLCSSSIVICCGSWNTVESISISLLLEDADNAVHVCMKFRAGHNMEANFRAPAVRHYSLSRLRRAAQPFYILSRFEMMQLQLAGESDAERSLVTCSGHLLVQSSVEKAIKRLLQ
jgi:hypothetical protein